MKPLKAGTWEMVGIDTGKVLVYWYSPSISHPEDMKNIFGIGKKINVFVDKKVYSAPLAEMKYQLIDYLEDQLSPQE